MGSLSPAGGVLPAGLAAAQSAPLFALPPGAEPARRSRFDRARLLDCAAHGVWAAPPGWSVARVASGDVLAVAPDGDAVLVRASTRSRGTRVRSTDAFVATTVAVVTRLADAPPALDAVAEETRSRWHVERRVHGTATVRGTSVSVHAQSGSERELWVWLAHGTAHDAELAAATSSWASLVSHACECGYDCDRRRE